MKGNKLFVRRFLIRLVLASALAGCALDIGTGVTAVAQNAAPVSRTVEGKVETKAGQPVKGAVVYIKDARSNSVRSAISGEDGSFRFVQLAQSTDYEIWARDQGVRSKSRSISSFDGKNSFNFTLVVDK